MSHTGAGRLAYHVEPRGVDLDSAAPERRRRRQMVTLAVYEVRDLEAARVRVFRQLRSRPLMRLEPSLSARRDSTIEQS